MAYVLVHCFHGANNDIQFMYLVTKCYGLYIYLLINFINLPSLYLFEILTRFSNGATYNVYPLQQFLIAPYVPGVA